MCNEEIIKHMKEDMTFRGLSYLQGNCGEYC